MERDFPLVLSCFYTGYPSPNVSWKAATGDSLPLGVYQNLSKPGVLQLHFTTPLPYEDMASFVCTATHISAVANATLDMIIRGILGLVYVK